MTDTRKKDVDWSIKSQQNGTYSFEAAQLAVLMDIRDELKALNNTLSCTETRRIPRYLRRIASNTAKPKKPKA